MDYYDGYYTRHLEEAKQKIQADINYFKFLVSNYGKLYPVFEAFDGKVYNKHFNEAISDLTDDDVRYSSYDSGKWFYIYVYKRNNPNYNRPSLLCVPSCAGDRFEDFFSRQDSIFSENKRIIAEKGIAQLDARKAKHEEKIAEYEKYLAESDNIIAQVEYFNGLLAAITKPIPYEIQTYLKLH